MWLYAPIGRSLLDLFVVQPYEVAVFQPAYGVVRPGDDLIAHLEAGQHLEILVAGNSHLDRDEFGVPVPHQENPLGLFAGLTRLELGGCRGLLERAAAAPLVGARPTNDLPVRVVDELAYRNGRDWHRHDGLPP